MDIGAYMYRVKSVMHSVHVTSCEQNTVHLGKVHLISQGGEGMKILKLEA